MAQLPGLLIAPVAVSVLPVVSRNGSPLPVSGVNGSSNCIHSLQQFLITSRVMCCSWRRRMQRQGGCGITGRLLRPADRPLQRSRNSHRNSPTSRHTNRKIPCLTRHIAQILTYRASQRTRADGLVRRTLHCMHHILTVYQRCDKTCDKPTTPIIPAG